MAWGSHMAAFAGGAIVAAHWPFTWLDSLPYGLLVLVIVLAGAIWQGWRQLAGGVAAFAIGAVYFSAAVFHANAGMLQSHCDGQSVTARLLLHEAKVVTTTRGDSQWRLLVSPEKDSLSRCFKINQPNIRLSWWQRGDATRSLRLRVGDSIDAEVKLRRPHSQLNPGGFDYVAWLWRQDIQATGYIKQIKQHRAADTPMAGPAASALGAARVQQQLDTVLADHPAKPVLKTLMLGDRSDVSPALWRQARETGIAHLLAISGLHLGLLVAAVMMLTLFISRRFPLQSGWSRFWLMLPAIAAATAYAALAGWPLSAQRALLMLMVAWVAFAWRWRVPVFTAWSLALGLVVLWQPLSVLDGGFYLSFAAVALLLWVASNLRSEEVLPKRSASSLWQWAVLAVNLQFYLFLGLLPLQLWLFGGFSLLSLPLNLLLVPLFALVVMPLLLLLGLLLALNVIAADYLLLVVAEGLEPLLLGLAKLHQLSAGSIWGWQVIGRPNAWLLCLLGLSVLLWLLPRALALRGLAALLLAVGVWQLYQPAADLAEPGRFRITSFDVGQGTALLVETQSHRMIYDTGPRWASGNSAMQMMVLPALGVLGVDLLDKVVISHDDNDHAGGLAPLITRFSSAELLGVESNPCQRGQEWHWDAVKFEVLSPLSGFNDSNNQSCVIRLSSQYGTALLTGDISASVERRLTKQTSLAADWLLVPHHGSKSSSHQSFINAVSADTAVITSGYKNRYRLPAPEVVARYQASEPSMRLYNTATDGAIRSVFGPGCGPCNQTEKQQRRWWQRLRESN